MHTYMQSQRRGGEGGIVARVYKKWFASAIQFNKIPKPGGSLLQPKGCKNYAHHATCRGEGGEEVGGGGRSRQSLGKTDRFSYLGLKNTLQIILGLKNYTYEDPPIFKSQISIGKNSIAGC